jgi:hypothetical protein
MLTTPDAISVRAGGWFERLVLLPGLTIAAGAAVAWQVPAVAELARSLTDSFQSPPAADG